MQSIILSENKKVYWILLLFIKSVGSLRRKLDNVDLNFIIF